MNEREEQIEWIAGALSGIGVEERDRAAAATLYSQGVRVLGRDEVIVSWADKVLLELVQQAAVQWESAKAAARAEPKSGPWVLQSKEDQILATMRQLGEPATKNVILSTAAGHAIGGRRFYLWRDAFLELADSGRIEAVDGEPGTFRKWALVGDGAQ